MLIASSIVDVGVLSEVLDYLIKRLLVFPF